MDLKIFTSCRNCVPNIRSLYEHQHQTQPSLDPVYNRFYAYSKASQRHWLR